MGGVGNALLISVIISALDRASPVLRLLGLNSIASMGLVTMGAAAVVGALGGIAFASIHAATTFDQSMHRIGALTDTSAAQMQWYEQQVLALAPQLDVAPTSLANGLYFVISAGEKGAQAIDTLKYAAMAAAAGMTDFGTVADGITSVINSYKAANLDAGTATDVLTKLVVNGKTTWSAIASSIGIVATTSAVAGVKVQEMAAAMARLSQTGGAHATRRLGMDFMNLERSIGINIDQIAAKAKKLHLAFDESKFASASFIDKLRMLASMTGGIGYLDKTQLKAYEATGNIKNLAAATAHANSMFLNLVGGAAAFIPAAILLSDKGKEYDHILQQMTTHGQATADAFNTMRESTGQKWNMFKVTLESILTIIGLQILPVVNKVLDAVWRFGQAIIAVINTTGGMQALKYALLGILLVAIIPLSIAIGSLLAGIAPFLLIVVGIVAAGILLGKVIQAVVAHFGGWAGVMKALHPILAQIGKLFNQAGTEIRKALADPAIQKAWKQLQQALPQIIPLLKVLAVIVGVVLFVAFQLIVAGIRQFIGALPGILMFARGLIEVLGGIGRLITDIFTGKWKDILPALKQIFGGVIDMVKGLFGAIFGGWGAVLDHFLGLFGSSGNKAKKAAGGWLGHIAGAVADFFTKTIPGIIGGAVHLWLNVMTAPFRLIGQLFVWLYHHNYYVQHLVDTIHLWLLRAKMYIMAAVVEIKTIFAKAWALIQADAAAAWKWVYAHIIKPVQDAIAWITGIAGRVKSAFQQHVVKPIEDTISKLISNALKWGENLLTNFIQGIKNKLGDLGKAAQGVIKTVGNWLGFHSPAPKVPESAQWGPNLIRMFAQGMVGASPVAGAAAAAVIARVAGQLTGRAPGGGGLGNAVGTRVVNTGSLGSLAGAIGGIGGGATTITHNWQGAFPNATSKDEIVAAIREVQQNDYRAGRRPGSYGGLGVHTSIR